MHAILVRIGKAEPVSVGNSLGKSQSEPGGTVFLRALIEPVENAALIQRRIPAVRNDQFVFCQCQCYCTALRAVHESVLDDVSDQNRGKSLIHPDNDRLIWNLYRTADSLAAENLLIQLLLGQNHRGKVYISLVRELVIVNLGKQKKSLVESHDMAEFTLHLDKFTHTFLSQRIIVQHPVNPSSEYGKRCLQLMRRIPDELFLLFKSLVGTVCRFCSDFLQLAEFMDVCIYGQAAVGFARSISVQPVKNL